MSYGWLASFLDHPNTCSGGSIYKSSHGVGIEAIHKFNNVVFLVTQINMPTATVQCLPFQQQRPLMRLHYLGAPISDMLILSEK